jgi:CO/xanthine dehydrogenase FAD-binding subunit
VKPSRFEYFAPTTIEECVELLERYGDDAKVLAGGQSLVPLMNLRLAAPEVLIDVNRVEELEFARLDGDQLALGAATRHHEVATSETVRDAVPMLAEAAAHIGYPAIRIRGTIGGSLAHADPVAEMPCVAVALDAEIVAVSARGRRTIGAREFFVSHFTTALEPDELLAEVRFARMPAEAGWAFEPFARKEGDFSIAEVGVELRLDSGAVSSARIGLGGLGDVPRRAAAVEERLVGAPLDEQRIAAAGESVAELAGSFAGSDDDPDYKSHLARTLTERALRRALENGRASR